MKTFIFSGVDADLSRINSSSVQTKYAIVCRNDCAGIIGYPARWVVIR